MRRELLKLSEQKLAARLIRAGKAEEPSEAAVMRTLAAIRAPRPLPGSAKVALGPSAWLKLAGLFVLVGGVAVSAWVALSAAKPSLPGPQPVAATSPGPVSSPSLPGASSAASIDIESLPAAEERQPVKSVAAVPAGSVPSASSSAAQQRADRLAAEVRALDEVRSALRQGAPSRALAHLDRFDADFPAPVMGTEAMVLRIEALARSGNTTAARRLAEQFLLTSPNGPFSDRVRALGGLPANP